MAQQTLDIGTGPDTKTGDPLRTGMTKANANFSDVYIAAGEDNNWTIRRSSEFADLATAISTVPAGTRLILDRNEAVPAQIEINKRLFLDGAGYAITRTGTTGQVFRLVAGADGTRFWGRGSKVQQGSVMDFDRTGLGGTTREEIHIGNCQDIVIDGWEFTDWDFIGLKWFASEFVRIINCRFIPGVDSQVALMPIFNSFAALFNGHRAAHKWEILDNLIRVGANNGGRGIQVDQGNGDFTDPVRVGAILRNHFEADAGALGGFDNIGAELFGFSEGIRVDENQFEDFPTACNFNRTRNSGAANNTILGVRFWGFEVNSDHCAFDNNDILGTPADGGNDVVGYEINGGQHNTIAGGSIRDVSAAYHIIDGSGGTDEPRHISILGGTVELHDGSVRTGTKRGVWSQTTPGYLPKDLTVVALEIKGNAAADAGTHRGMDLGFSKGYIAANDLRDCDDGVAYQGHAGLAENLDNVTFAWNRMRDVTTRYNELNSFIGSDVHIIDDSDHNRVVIGKLRRSAKLHVATAADGGVADGDGSPEKPFLTVREALLALPDQTLDTVLSDVGYIQVGPGAFQEPIVPLRINGRVILEGDGIPSDLSAPSGTVIQLPNGANTDLIAPDAAFEAASGNSHGVILKNLMLHGNKANQSSVTITGASLTFTDGVNPTISRAAGDFVVDGIVAGLFEVRGGLNTGIWEVITVAAGTLTLHARHQGAIRAEGPTTTPVIYQAAGALLRMHDGGFHCYLEQVAFQNAIWFGLHQVGNAVNLHLQGCTWAGIDGRSIFAQLGSNPTMLRLDEGQIDNGGYIPIEIWRDSTGGQQVYLVDGLKLEATSVDHHMFGIAVRPPQNQVIGEPAVFIGRGITAAHTSAGRDAVIYEQYRAGGTAAIATSFMLDFIIGRTSYTNAFRSAHTGEVSFGNFLRMGRFRGNELFSNNRMPWAEIEGVRHWVGTENPNSQALWDTEPLGSEFIYKTGPQGGKRWLKDASGAGQWYPIITTREYGRNLIAAGVDPTGAVDASSIITSEMNAVAQNGTNRSRLWLPYGTVRIDSTILWRTRVALIGGEENFATSNPHPEIQWFGAAGGTMIQTEVPGTTPNHRGFMKNLRLNARDLANDIIDVRSRIDWTGGFEEVQLMDSRRHGIVLRQGAINFKFLGGRADDVGGFVFAVLDDGAGFNGVVSNFICRDATFDFAKTGVQGSGQGMLLLDYESIAASPYFFGKFEGCHLELNAELETWLPLVGDRDRAIMAIGHNNNYTQNAGRVNAQIQWDNMRVAVGAATEYAIAKLSQTADFLLFTWNNCNFGRNGKTVSIVDNTTTPGPDITSENLWLHLTGSWGPHGQGGIGNIRRDFHQGEIFMDGLFLGSFTTANLPAASADLNNRVALEDDATNGRNFVYYLNGQRFRVAGISFV